MDSENKKTNRLGSESIPRLLFSMALPTLLAQLVNLLYNIVDRAFVGHIAGTGSLALAGLGVCFPVTLLLSAFAVLVGMGGASRASIAMGEKNYSKAEHILGNCAMLAIIFSVLTLVIFELTCEPLLSVTGAGSEVLPYAVSYMRIYLIGTPFVMATMGLNGFITNQGFAKTSMATICIGAAINIVLDPLLIFNFGMGVRGAAIATVIAQGVSALWVLIFLNGKKGSIRIRAKEMRLDRRTVALVISLGMSPFMMNVTECAVQFTYNISISQYGELYVALHSVLFTLISIIWMPMTGFAQGAAPIISFNYGAQRLDRARGTFNLLFIIDMIFAVGVVALIEIFPHAVLAVFTNDPELIALGTTPLRVYLFGFCLMGAQSACQQTFLALGQAKISMFLATLRKMFLIWPLALILPHLWGLGVWGLFIAEPIADLIAGTVTYLTFRVKSKKLLY